MTDGGPNPKRRRLRSAWAPWMALWAVIGLAIRVGAVLGRPTRRAGGDAFYYHNAANLLVEGHGFINPFLYYGHHQVVKTAAFPPGFVFVLAAASLVGLKSYYAHRMWCAVIGAGAVVACGWAGREVGGRRVGILTAALVAVYPNLWMSDEMAMSETLSPLLVALVLVAAYRFWRRPDLRRAVWLGLALGGAALCRDELASLGIFLVVPLTLGARRLSWAGRARALAAAAVCALAVVAPWVGWNMSRFSKPVFISTGLGPTLASTNCPLLYDGSSEGYWAMSCALAVPVDPTADESVQSSQEQAYATRIIRANAARIPGVEAVRIGRAFGFYRPFQQIRFDSLIETRPRHWALLGLWMYWALLAAGAAGVILLRAEGVAVYPLLAVGATVIVAVLLSFGDTRYRTPFEVSLVILAAAGADRLASRSKRRPSRADDGRGHGAEREPVGAGAL